MAANAAKTYGASSDACAAVAFGRHFTARYIGRSARAAVASGTANTAVPADPSGTAYTSGTSSYTCAVACRFHDAVIDDDAAECAAISSGTTAPCAAAFTDLIGGQADPVIAIESYTSVATAASTDPCAVSDGRSRHMRTVPDRYLPARTACGTCAAVTMFSLGTGDRVPHKRRAGWTASSSGTAGTSADPRSAAGGHR
jgi:hypothetical protein